MIHRCQCVWSKPSFESYWTETANSMEMMKEECWSNQKVYDWATPYYYIKNNTWIDTYFTFAFIQWLLLYSQPALESLIQKMNKYDTKMTTKLVSKYQIITKKIFDCKYEQNKKCLYILSHNILPTVINQLTLEFTTKSQRDKIIEIQNMNESNIKNQKWHWCYDKLAKLMLVFQIFLIGGLVSWILRKCQDVALFYCTSFTLILILGTVDRILQWIVFIGA